MSENIEQNERSEWSTEQYLSFAIGRQIRIARKSQGLTGKALGKCLGVSQQQVSRYENGVCLLDIVGLMQLLQILDVSLDEFFMRVSLTLKTYSPKTYALYHTLFFPMVNFSLNDDFFLLGKPMLN